LFLFIPVKVPSDLLSAGKVFMRFRWESKESNQLVHL
jgi:hypothetical protein